MDEKLEKLIAIIKEYADPEAGEISRDSQLNADLGINSLSFFTILEDIEQAFDVEVEDGQLEGIRTVGDIVDLLA